MSSESLATRALPAAFSRSSSTMPCRRSSVSPEPPIVEIMPLAISASSAVAFLIFKSLSANLSSSIFFCAALIETSRARISSL